MDIPSLFGWTTKRESCLHNGSSLNQYCGAPDLR